jgi:hypothetical protein
MSKTPIAIYNSRTDVFVTLEDYNSKYLLEVTIPPALASNMNERKQRFVELLCLFRIV